MNPVNIAATLDKLREPVDSLNHYPRNPRRGDVETIKRSLERNGQYRPIVVNVRTREVLAGNHTLKAARELGWPQIAVTFVDVDDEQAARIALVDNRANDLAGYDDAELARLLESFDGDLDATGFNPGDLDQLLADLSSGDAGRDTEPTEPPAEPRTRPGDLYVLGGHRLLCGDATETTDLTRLLDGRSDVELLWTDPPFGVNYVGKTARALKIQGDSPNGIAALLADAFSTIDPMLAPGARFYIAAPPGPQELTFMAAVADVGWQLHQTLVWVKDTIVLGHSDYHYQHEPVLYGWKIGSGRVGRGNHEGTRWQGDHSASSVFAIDRPKRSAEHPTMKPLELVGTQVANSTRPGDPVLDPFCGSGTTLIACENLGRRCYALEIDPGYCEVIVDRWQRHTGQSATLERKRRRRGT
jgi:DNA modification methylase